MKAGRPRKAVKTLQAANTMLNETAAEGTAETTDIDLTENETAEVDEATTATSAENPEITRLLVEFRTLYRQHQRDIVETICVLGVILNQLRSLITESFEKTVNERLPISPATATRYIKIAELNEADSAFVDHWKSIGSAKLYYLTYLRTAEERLKTLAPYSPEDLERMSQPAVAALVGYQGEEVDQQLDFDKQSKVFKRFIMHAGRRVTELKEWVAANPGKELDEDLIQEFDALKVAVMELRKIIR